MAILSTHLSSLAIVQAKMIASAEIESSCTVCILVQIDRQHFLSVRTKQCSVKKTR